MINKLQKERTEKLIKIIRENPELPIVPMVDYEVVAEDSGRWLGSWGNCCIGEYVLGQERIHFREEDDWDEIENTLTDGVITYDDYETMSEENAKQMYDSLPWIKAIIVNIELPEAEEL